ncbi:hypothetical protein DPEC_G00182140 [Dallia pectoralis]|uniref:Uncharacterized protein n=1 Tax=Dallia pectoralis TaxID=75939 RepID=A0ACC2GAU9_DALPE|nr:hypothetical protein DPEC_G00182140 [Dallia pectoralis]
MDIDAKYRYDTVNPIEVNTAFITHTICFTEISCALYLAINIVTFLVGVLGNGLVVWIAGFEMKKTVNTTWHLGLAAFDFIFCAAYLPMKILHITTNAWVSIVTCDLANALLLITMFSTAFLLVLVGVDRCVLVVYPAWAQNNRTAGKAVAMVTLAWVSSVALSTRFAFIDNQTRGLEMQAVSQFIGGFAMPFLVILVCLCVVIRRLGTRPTMMMIVSSKPLRVMNALIATYFICWLPYHVILLLYQNHKHYNREVLRAGHMLGELLAIALGFLRPVLYVCMGNDVEPTLMRSVIYRIENAIGEDDEFSPTTSTSTTRTTSTSGGTSTHP